MHVTARDGLVEKHMMNCIRLSNTDFVVMGIEERRRQGKDAKLT